MPGAERTTSTAPSAHLRNARFAVAVLTAMNLLNYVDRYLPSAVKDLFKKDLALTDAQTSLPLTAFVVVYMLASPIFGSLADRYSRNRLIAAGVALWSAATAAAAFAQSFTMFLVARAAVGIGEAAYATISPSLLSDYFPPARRNRVLTIFYVAIPVGAAIGFTVGGILGAHFGWRMAFLACGLPGLATAALVLMIREPARGAFDAPTLCPPVAASTWPEALRLLARNRPYLFAVLGYVAVTFASGALADWFPTFLARHRGFTLAEADTLVGTTAVVGGLGGTLLGGFCGDRLRGRTRHPYLAVSALSLFTATLFALLAIRLHDRFAIGACVLTAQLFLWFYNGPINTVIVNAVSSALRNRAFSVSILCIHLFGDALSPLLVGAIADRASLPLALALVPASLLVGTLVWAFAWRALPEGTDA